MSDKVKKKIVKKVATEKSSAEKAVATEKTPEFKYGVSDLAEALNIKPASVRVKLRNAEVAKNGKSYGWNSKADLQAVINQLNKKEEKEEESSEE